MTEGDRRHMRRALELARRGWGRTAPNPMVGAVIVADGEVVGEGWHEAFGEAHAEAAALSTAGDRARDATVYVNLEPCAHTGKTPPCAEALVEAGVGRVVVGCRDPHPEAGGGVRRLREAGVEVETGVEGMAAGRLNAPFLWRQTDARPFATLKLALSLDARIAAREGERTGVTGPAAGRFTHRLRAGHDAILVGRRTAEVDDPRLTARGDPTPRVPPVRVVLDTGARLPLEGRLASTAGDVPVWVMCGPGTPEERRDALRAAGVEVIPVGEGDGRSGIAPGAALARLADRGVDSVLVEGGGRVAASFLRDGGLQRLHLLYAPVLFGPDGVPGFPDVAPTSGEWIPVGRRALGRDTLITLESRSLTERLRELAEPW